MNLDGLLNLAGQIVTVALVATILMRGSQFAQIVKAIAEGFASSLRAAKA